MDKMDEIVTNPSARADSEKYASLIASYEDSHTSFHPSGIHDPDLFSEITSRKSCHIEDGVPMWVGAQDVDFLVDTGRCKEIISRIDTDKAQTARIDLALVPLDHIVASPSSFNLLEGNSWVIAEYQDDGRYDDLLAEANKNGIQLERLIHPESGTEASMKLFEFTARAEKIVPEPVNLNEALAQNRIPAIEEMEDGGSLRVSRGGSFNAHEQEQLWDLFSTRFQDISQNMPMKLEENEEATQELLQDPNYTFIYKVEPTGNIACCVFATDQREAYPWISEEFTQYTSERDKEKYGKTPHEIFVPGVAAYEQEGIRASTPVMQRFADLIASTGQELFAIRAECTDVSALYIPGIVMKNLHANKNFTGADLQELGEKKIIFARHQPAVA